MIEKSEMTRKRLDKTRKVKINNYKARKQENAARKVTNHRYLDKFMYIVYSLFKGDDKND